MKAVRETFSQLVERRLWPIAVVLVAALVAIPLVLAKSAPPNGAAAAAPARPAVVAAAATAPSTPVVSVAVTAPKGTKLRGRVKNPFRQQHVPKPPATATGGGDPVLDGSGNGGSLGGAPGTPGTPNPQKTYTRVAIDVTFGLAIGSKRTITDVPRLTPLPNAASPIVIFLGMRADHQTAVFMVSSDVHAQGDVTCVPSRKTCESIEMKEGQVAFLDVTGPGGRVKQYELDLDKVTVTETTSKVDARASYARVSRRGKRVLRISAKITAHATGRPRRMPFRYAAERGVLHIAPYLSAQRRTHHRHASGATTQARAVADPHAPSLTDVAP